MTDIRFLDAGQLRDMGVSIDSKIPDHAIAPALVFLGSGPPKSEGAFFKVPCRVKLTGVFRWDEDCIK